MKYDLDAADKVYSLDALEKMWDEFGDTPINSDDEIEEDFYWWEKGTDRFEVWHWFGEKLPNGLGEWMSPSSEKE